MSSTAARRRGEGGGAARAPKVVHVRPTVLIGGRVLVLKVNVDERSLYLLERLEAELQALRDIVRLPHLLLKNVSEMFEYLFDAVVAAVTGD